MNFKIEIMNPSPFDAIAPSYDDDYTDTTVGRYQRAVVTDILTRRFRSGMRILEIGCGTGVDTVFLARQGIRVTAIDASPRMVDIARQRVAEARLEDLVELKACSAEEVACATPGEPFDGLFSDFGVLNCLDNPELIGTLAGNWLKPGGYAVLCLIGRWCAWEIAAHIVQLQPRTAFRRLQRDGADVSIGEASVHVIYPPPKTAVEICKPHCWHLISTGVGVLIPPSYMNPLVDRFPRSFRFLRSLDTYFNRLPLFNNLGDHYCLELQRQ